MLRKIVINLICLLILTGCTSYAVKDEATLISKTSDINLLIEEIGIDERLYISSAKDEVNGIVLFSEYGRPNYENTNTVIGAHSGYGPNAYFNDLILLEKGDKVILKYNGSKYEYEVEKVYEVKDTEVEVLNNRGYNTLSLITCKIGDSSKRVIVDARLIN